MIAGEPLYQRYGSPSREAVEAVLASLESGEHAMCFSSGNKIAITPSLGATIFREKLGGGNKLLFYRRLRRPLFV